MNKSSELIWDCIKGLILLTLLSLSGFVASSQTKFEQAIAHAENTQE